MAILHSCCFWKSVRKGSFASAIYTIFYFGSSCAIISTNLYDEQQFLSGEVEKPRGESFLEKEAISPTTVIFNILLLITSFLGLLSSILLIIGLKMDKRYLILPWILVLLADLLIELSHFIYLIIIKTLHFEPLTAILFTLDFFIMCLNIYCLVCVISQYQEYKSGRGYMRGESSRKKEVKKKYLTPTPTTHTVNCMRTFRTNCSKTATSPLIYGHSNFSAIPEEPTQPDDKQDVESPVTVTSTNNRTQCNSNSNNNSFKKKHVQFKDKKVNDDDYVVNYEHDGRQSPGGGDKDDSSLCFPLFIKDKKLPDYRDIVVIPATKDWRNKQKN